MSKEKKQKEYPPVTFQIIVAIALLPILMVYWVGTLIVGITELCHQKWNKWLEELTPPTTGN